MFLECLVVGPFQCNCLVIGCEESREAVLVDPGDDAQRILDVLKSNGLTAKALLHTHAHLDHVGASTEISQELEIPIYLHQEDASLYEMLPTQGAMFGLKINSPKPVDSWLEDGQIYGFGSHELKTVHTPGHSPGSVCFEMVSAAGLLLSGDTLFAGSIGRTDLWGGNYEQIIRSIKERLLIMDDDTRVIPGHGPETTIGRERKSNPFLG